MAMNISFYSYKGGVGRTQLCANVAAYLCFHKEMKILLWDWDFEAPGLHTYFKVEEDRIRRGTLELLEDYMRLMRGNERVNIADLKKINEEDIIKVESHGEGKIDLISAGNYNKNYPSRLVDFQWFEFFSGYDGGAYIDFLKQEIGKLDYDFVFIDARTGISDYAGICNVLLPDANVFVIGPNKQNIEGNKLMIDRVIQHPYLAEVKKKPIILPIFSRLDEQDVQKLQFWIEEFKDVFSKFIPQLMSEGEVEETEVNAFIREFLEETCLPYSPMLAFGENIIFNKDKKDVFTFGFQQRYINIAKCFCDLKDDGFTRLQPENEYLNPIIKFDSDFNETLARGKKVLEKANNVDTPFTESLKLFKNAEVIFDGLLKDNELSYDLLKGLGEAYIGLGEFEKALSTLKRIAEEDDEVWMLKSKCLIELGRHDEVDVEKFKRPDFEITIQHEIAGLTASSYLDEGDEDKGLAIINFLNNKIRIEAEQGIEKIKSE